MDRKSYITYTLEELVRYAKSGIRAVIKNGAVIRWEVEW